MANLRSALSIFVLFAVASAAVISSNDNAVVVRDATSRDVSPLNSPLFVDNSVLVSDANERIVLAAFAANAAIGVAACTFGGPIACITVGVTAVLSTFWGLFKASSNGPIMELNTGHTLTLTHPQWQPTADCDLACKLQAGVEPETWTPFANVAVDGHEHVLHYFRTGNTNGLKAVPVTNASSDATRRSDIDDAGGYVASYFWNDGNQNAWKAWNAGADSGIESQVSNYILGGHYEVICVDLEDAAGDLDAGVMTIGTGNTAIILSPSQLPLYLNSCAAGE